MADPIINFFKSTLVGTYSNSATSLTIATGDGALLPDPSVDGAFNLTIFEGVQVTNSTSFEIVRVTARSGDVLTVTRGAESTTPLTIGSATYSILMSATKKTFDDINDAIDNVDLTSLTGVEELTFDSTGDEEFGLPAGTTAQRPASPSAGYMRWNSTLSRIEFYNGSRWAGLSEIGFQSETMQVAQLSVTANDAVAENIAPEVEYLVIAGGGGGGGGIGGGGGAGGYRSSVVGESSGGGASAESVFEPTLATNYTVTVGAGGSAAGSSTRGSQGSNSVFNAITSTGGGGGGGRESNQTGGSGGSGGGGGGHISTINPAGGSGTTNQGYAGGTGFGIGDAPAAGAGGGGAFEVGATASSNTAGDGGDGVSSSITGTAVTRAGGGGGCASVTNGLGGNGGGGDGSLRTSTASVAGTANTGGGGGGGSSIFNHGANGGSGVVILRYSAGLSITIGAGLTGTETTDGSEKYAVITAGTGNVSWN